MMLWELPDDRLSCQLPVDVKGWQVMSLLLKVSGAVV